MPPAVDIVHNRGIASVNFMPMLECMGVYLYMHALTVE